MAQTSEKIERIRYELKPRPARVVSVTELNPAYKRIVVTGEEFHDFQTKSPADHIKVALEVDGERIMRDYTPRSFENGELTLEFALHADGPVTTWARNAEVGSELTILGPRGSAVTKPVFDAYVYIGDETLLPGIGRAMELVPADAKFIGVAEIESAADKIELPADENDTIIWAERNGRTTGEALIGALNGMEWPEGEVWVYIGGEATSVRDARRHVLNDRGLSRENLGMSGHWKLGQSDFDHHAPIEE